MGLRSSRSNSSLGMPMSPAVVAAKLDKHCSRWTSQPPLLLLPQPDEFWASHPPVPSAIDMCTVTTSILYSEPTKRTRVSFMS